MLKPAEIIERQEQIAGTRITWDDHWREIAELVWPQANEFREEHTRGEKRTERVFDNTATRALEKFSAGLEALLTPRGHRWHRLIASDDDLMDEPGVREWFEVVTETLFRVRESPIAAFHSNMHEGYKSLGAFGTSCMYVDRLPGRGIRYKNVHIGEVFMATGPTGMVDTVYRRYKLSAKAIVQRWGDAAPSSIRAAADKYGAQKFALIHAVIPRGWTDPDSLGPERMPYEEYHVAVDDKVFLEAPRGFWEQPYIVGRYTVNPAEEYGRGPGMMVLNDVKTLQVLERDLLRIAHKSADPPLLVADDNVAGGFDSNKVRLNPGGLTHGAIDSQGRQLVAPLLSGSRPEEAAAILEHKRMSVEDAFLVTLWRILNERPPNMTATEALLLEQEKGELLGPPIGRQQTETLGPLINREVNILDRMGLLPDPPPAILEAEGEFKIEYESEISRNRNAYKHLALLETVGLLQPLLEFDPGAMDRVNVDAALKDIATEKGASPTWIRSDEEMDERRAAQVSAQEEASALEAAPAASGMVRDLAAAAGQTPGG